MLYESKKTARNMATTNRLFLGTSGATALWETFVIIYKIAKDGPITVSQLIDYMTMRQKAIYTKGKGDKEGITNEVIIDQQKISVQVRHARELFNLTIRCGANGYVLYRWGVLREEQFLQFVEKHEEENFVKTRAMIAAQARSEKIKAAKAASSPAPVEK